MTTARLTKCSDVEDLNVRGAIVFLAVVSGVFLVYLTNEISTALYGFENRLTFDNLFWGFLFGLPASAVLYLAGFPRQSDWVIDLWFILLLVWPIVLSVLLYKALGALSRTRSNVIKITTYAALFLSMFAVVQVDGNTDPSYDKIWTHWWNISLGDS